MFRDRADAAHALAAALQGWRGSHPLVLAIPRGAVPMGAIIARALEGDLDVVLTRKLGAPGHKEFAIGAVAESGWTRIEDYASRTGADEDYIAHEVEAQMQRMRERRASYTGAAPPIDPAGRIVIVVDDGLATGSTMIVALHATREKHPQRLICAVPVAPPTTVERVAQHCDEVVCLQQPFDFQAVGQFYFNFAQVEDEEVVAALKAARAEKGLSVQR